MANYSFKFTNRKGWFAFIYAFFVLICFYPYEFYSMYFFFVPDNKLTLQILFLVMSSVLLFFNRFKKPSSSFFFVLMMQVFGFFITDIMHGNNINMVLGRLIPIFAVVVLIFYLDSSIGLVEFYKRYNKWILLMAILGTVAFVLGSFFGLKPLYFVFDRADERPIYNYILTFTKSDASGGQFLRYSGFFDEPGAMGQWGMYALIINKLFIKNDKIEKILLVALLFTFSMGYYLQLALYLLFFYLNTHRRANNVMVITAVAAIFVLFGLTQRSSSREISEGRGNIYDFSIGRIVNTLDEAQSSGDALNAGSRIGLADNARDIFLKNPLFGTSHTTLEDVRYGDNFYESLALYGVVGCIFVLYPFWTLLIWGIRRRDPDLWKCALVITLGFTNRPFHTNVLYYFIIYSIVFMYLQSIRKDAVLLGYR